MPHLSWCLSLLVYSLARQCALLWLKTRESLGHPLGVVSETVDHVCPKEVLEAAVKKVSLNISSPPPPFVIALLKLLGAYL